MSCSIGNVCVSEQKSPLAALSRFDMKIIDLLQIQNLQVPVPICERDRIKVLRETNVLDTAAEERFDRYTALAARVFKTKIALVSLVDVSRQWFKSRVGLAAIQTHRDDAFCAYAILESSPDVFVVENALEDARFCNNVLVQGPPNIRFYAGASLEVNNLKLGTLCIIHDEPRSFSEADRLKLRDIAAMISDLLTEQRNKELRAMGEVALINSSVLQTIHRPLKKLMHMKEELSKRVEESKLTCASPVPKNRQSECVLASLRTRVQGFSAEVNRFHKLLEMCLQVSIRLLPCRNTEWQGILPCYFDEVMEITKEMAQDIMPSQELQVVINALEAGAECFSYPDVMVLAIIAILNLSSHENRKGTSLNITTEHHKNVSFTNGQLLKLFDPSLQQGFVRRSPTSNRDQLMNKQTKAMTPTAEMGFSGKSQFLNNAFHKGSISINISTVNKVPLSPSCSGPLVESFADNEILAIMTILNWVSGTLKQSPTAEGIDFEITLPSMLSTSRPESSSSDTEELQSAAISLPPSSVDDLEELLTTELRIKPERAPTHVGDLNIVRAIWNSFKLSSANSSFILPINTSTAQYITTMENLDDVDGTRHET